MIPPHKKFNTTGLCKTLKTATTRAEQPQHAQNSVDFWGLYFYHKTICKILLLKANFTGFI